MKKSLFKIAFVVILFFTPLAFCQAVTHDCRQGTGCGSDVFSCDETIADCAIETNWTVSTDCDYSALQACTPNQSYCSPSAGCLAAPILASPTNGQEKIPLPLSIDWNDVTGALSYRYMIFKNDGSLEYNGGPVTGSSVVLDSTLHVLQSDTNYSWQAQACIDSAGAACGLWSDKWSFKSSSAPQPISPTLDSTTHFPINFEWSGNQKTKSYFLRFINVRTAKMDFLNQLFLHREGELEDIWSFDCCTSDLCPSQILPDGVDEPNPTATKISFDIGIFTKNSDYVWMAASCLQDNCEQCGKTCGEGDSPEKCVELSADGVQKFKTGNLTLNAPILKQPAYSLSQSQIIPSVNLSDSLQWNWATGSIFYLYEIKEDISNEIIVSNIVYGDENEAPLSGLWNKFELNKIYSWRVAPCWMNGSFKAECENTWSETWKFKTTGAPPTLNNSSSGPQNNSENVEIPVKLAWDNVPGAASYTYEISDDENFSHISKSDNTDLRFTIIDYPIVNQIKNYWWRVKSCASEGESSCGEWTMPQKFTTIRLSLPQSFTPENNGDLFTSRQYLDIEPITSAKFYQYKVDYYSLTQEEKDTENCGDLAGKQIIQPTTVSSESIFLPLLCLGNYDWWIKSCLDRDCVDSSDWGGPFRFTLTQRENSQSKSIVPCGRYYDDPKTSWNERETCQIKHIFLLLTNILDFILWRLGLIILAILIITTGVIFYFSIGSTNALIIIKKILNSALRGYAIMFLAWAVVNIVMIFVGYRVETFGEWWRLHF